MYPRYLFVFHLFAFSSAIFFALPSLANPMTYRYWDLSPGYTRDLYQIAVLHLALEKTKNTYGAYEFIQIKHQYTAKRAMREISRGEEINIEANPHFSNGVELAGDQWAQNFRIDIPLLRGLLGCRQLVVRRQDLDKFQRIKTAEQLKLLKAGQGKDWDEVSVYKYNGYSISDSANYQNLLPQLVAGRFDYVPFSVIEVEQILKDSPQYAAQLAIVPNLLIYYPFPVFFTVSEQYPELAARLRDGLIMAQADGSLDQVFNQYFPDVNQIISSSANRVFVLANPSVPESLKSRMPSAVLQDKH